MQSFLKKVLFFWSCLLPLCNHATLAQSPFRVQLDSMLPLLKGEISDSQRMGLLIGISNKYMKLQSDSMHFYVDQLLALSEKTNSVRGFRSAYQFLGIAAEFDFDYNTAIQYYRKALVYAKASTKPGIAGNIYDNIGRNKYYLEELDSSIYYIKEGMKVNRSLENWTYVGLGYNTLGQISIKQNDYEQAIAYFLAANDEFKKDDAWEWLAGMHNNIGHVYERIDLYEEAIEQFEMALAIVEEKDYQTDIQLYLQNIGECYLGLEQYQKALPYLYKALQGAKESDNKEVIQLSYNSLGTCMLALDSLNQSIAYSNKALAIAEQTNDWYARFFANHNLAKVYRNKGAIHKAEVYFNTALDLVEKYGDQEMKMNLLKDMSAFYGEQENYEAAFNQFKAYNVIEDSFFNVEKISRIAALQKKYETAEREKEISQLKQRELEQGIQLAQSQRNNAFYLLGILALLVAGSFYFIRYQEKQKANKDLAHKNQLIAAQNKDLAQKQGQLHQSLQEKEVLLKEIHHRVKNNLQLITSLLNLQAAGAPQQSLEDFLYNGQHRVKSMALIHERLYLSDNVSAIEIGAYTQDLVNSIFESFSVEDHIQYHIESEQVLLDIDQAIPVGLIINELVTNSLKHAFQNQAQGRLAVKVSKEDQAVLLIVEDDGIGLEESEDKNSMGLELVRLLVRQLKGVFKLTHLKGTQAQISFNLLP